MHLHLRSVRLRELSLDRGPRREDAPGTQPTATASCLCFPASPAPSPARSVSSNCAFPLRRRLRAETALFCLLRRWLRTPKLRQATAFFGIKGSCSGTVDLKDLGLWWTALFSVLPLYFQAFAALLSVFGCFIFRFWPPYFQFWPLYFQTFSMLWDSLGGWVLYQSRM